ncbi:MAG: hypothetical protein JO312_22910, partial [Hyphomicrobiales bacterium]|nr:hypothetical protein [Hyphomicrobiales bacterium]
EAGSRIFLNTAAAMQDPLGGPQGVDLSKFVSDQTPAVQDALAPIRRLAFGDGAHGCLGPEIVLAEIREVLKQLLKLKNLRRAAGLAGKMTDSDALPVSLAIRYDPQTPSTEAAAEASLAPAVGAAGPATPISQ